MRTSLSGHLLKTVLIKTGICLFIVLLTALIYWQTHNHGPVNADDFYLTTNPHFDNAYSYQGLLDGMSSLTAGVWMPLVYLSIGAQMELFGTDFGAYHLVSACVHAVNSIILFLLLLQMTRALWKSALVAVIFAIHPLNVEPVAWMVCIRVVQSGFFCLLTVYFYALYVHKQSSLFYTLSLFCYVASLLSVPMFPAMPCLLLVLDFWPLDRLRAEQNQGSRQIVSLSNLPRAAWEKFPFFGIMAVFIIVLLFSHDLSTSSEIEKYPFHDRLFNVFFSYAAYIQQTLLPLDLAVFYPFPRQFPLWKITGALLLLVTITAVSIRYIRRHPYLIAGWLWFAGMLFPLSGISQIGTQARADHYIYIPIIGLLIMIFWGTAGLIGRRKVPGVVPAIMSIVIIGLLTVLSRQQAGHWKNSVDLMTHAINATKGNYEAHNYLGQALVSQNRIQKAVEHFNTALSIRPGHIKSHVNLANVYAGKGNIDKAIFHLNRALDKTPENARLHNNLGALYEKIRNVPEALWHYRQAISINPYYAAAYVNLAVLEAAHGDQKSAMAYFQRALDINPRSAETHVRFAIALHRFKNTRAAMDHLQQAIILDPTNSEYRRLMAVLQQKQTGIE